MPTFPRTKEPHGAGALKGRMAMASVTDRGYQQVRSTTARGFTWTETWNALQAGDPDVEALLAFIRYHARAGTFLDVTHLGTPGSGLSPNGTGSSGVTVSGASQTGSSLVTTGWPLSTSNVVCTGDLLRVGGLNCAFLVTADASSDGSGNATLSLDPPIITGGSPADGASITTTSNVLRARIAAYDIPDVNPGDWFTGMTVTFLEAP